ncbi:MAG TPA: hypothetical protein DCX77_03275, partial [Acidimicrobiaceae bacterium]|nr:hypothetical protein [Acidimicrobiaceae bacterium]
VEAEVVVASPFIGLFNNNCVPENKSLTSDTAKLPILKPAVERSGVEDSEIVRLTGLGATLP